LISVWNAPLNAKATPGADFCFGCCATVKFRERERKRGECLVPTKGFKRAFTLLETKRTRGGGGGGRRG
jgi:hypothetical protein